jgi:hypothetical protein
VKDAVHIMVAGKQKERQEGVGGHNILLKCAPNDWTSSSLKGYKGYATILIAPQAGQQTFKTHGALGEIYSILSI